MRIGILLPIFMILAAGISPAQDAPVSISEFSWNAAIQPSAVPTAPSEPRAQEMTVYDTYAGRKARENQMRGTQDPKDLTPDARRATLDRIDEESRTPKQKDLTGYIYRALVKNNTGVPVSVLYWEYRFTELADPKNVIRRQFLCAVDMKPGNSKELRFFSTLAPSNTVAAGGLSMDSKKLFREEAFINRIELADNSVLQRSEWKFADVKRSVERATSTSWGKDTCREL